MASGKCDVQVRWIGSNGEARATNRVTIDVSESLLKEVITYE